MAINKVIYGDETLIDLTEDTVSSKALVKGVTAHRRDGVVIEGELDLEGMIADEYDSTAMYSVGDYVLYEGVLYQCITDISIPEEWNTGHWEAVTITDELKEKADISEVEKKADAIVSSVSGDIITIEDGADGLPVKSLDVSFFPIQDLRGYDYPWPAGKNRNVFDSPNANWKYNYYLDASGEEISNTGYRYTQEYTPLLSSTQYTVQMNKTTTTQAGLTLCEYDENKTFIQRNTIISASSSTGVLSGTFTTTATTKYIRFSAPYVSGEANIGAYHFQIELGSTATDFVSYSNICSISGWTGVEIKQGGANFYNSSDTISLNTSVSTVTIISTDSIEVVGKSSGTYPSSKQELSTYNLITGKTYIVEADVTVTSGSGRMAVRNSDNYVLAGTEYIDASGHASFLFTYRGVGTDYLSFFSNGNTSGGDVTYSNIKFYEYKQITYEWTDEAGIVYKGMVNPITGLLTVNQIVKTFDGTESYSTSGNISGTYKAYRLGDNGYVINDEAISSHLEERPDISGSNEFIGFRVYNRTTSPSGAYILIRFVYNQSKADLNAYLAEQYANGTPFQVCYSLAQPIEYQLTPIQVRSLLGTNIFWSNANGQIDLEYRADTKLCIEFNMPPPAADPISFTAALPSASWSDYALTIFDQRLIASGYTYMVSASSASTRDYQNADIYADDVTTDGQMTFHCVETPTNDLTVNIIRLELGE